MSTKAHAQHNKSVCDHLFSNTTFYDWVVTTAFYAALHFVQSKIFPFTEKSETFNNIDEYVAYFYQKNGKELSKHAATNKLVKERIPEIRKEYRKLFDTCMTARYSYYKVQKIVAADAKAELSIIESACK